MSTSAENRAAPLALDPSLPFDELRAVMHRAGLNEGSVKRLLDVRSSGQLPVLQQPVYCRRVTTDGPLETFVRLLLLNVPVTLDAFTRAVAPLAPGDLVTMGLVRIDGTTVTSPYTLTEHDGLYFVADNYRVFGEGQDPPADFVSSVNMTSTVLAAATVRRPVDRALDLGTGCGVLALLAARHAKHVVATDVNARCLNFTMFNARLNGVENVEVRSGSYFEPVAGETFDLIVTNPPFVISPEAKYVYRDGGKPGDTVTEQILKQMPNHLAEGGLGHLIGNWAFQNKGNWADPLERWLGNRGCDVIALLHSTQDPIGYAGNWLSSDYLTRPREFDQALGRWLGAYQQMGVERIASGVVVIRKRTPGGTSPGNWFQAYQTPQYNMSPCGAQLSNLMTLIDYCSVHVQGPAGLAEVPLVLDPAHQVEQTLMPAPDGSGYQVRGCRLVQPGGLGFERRVDSVGVELLSRLDGVRPVGVITREMAAERGFPPEFTQRSLEALFQLMLVGFVWPAACPPAEHASGK